jgi:Arm DNA-binding domain
MSQSFKVLFYLKKGNGKKEGILPVYVRLTVDGKRVEWSVQQNCDETKWNKQAGRMYGAKGEAKKLNLFLDAIQAHIFDIQRDHALCKERITAEQVKLLLTHQGVPLSIGTK